MLFILLWVFPRELFFPWLFSLRSKTFTSKKWGWKHPPHDKLLACHATIGVLFHCPWEYILCRIARSKQKYFFHWIIVSQGSKQWPQFACCIVRTQAICDCWLQEMTTTIVFFFIVMSKATTTTFFTLHREGASKYDNNLNIVQDARVSCKGMMTMQQSNIICCIARSNDIDTFFIVMGGSKSTSYCKDASNDKGQLQGYGNDGPPCNNQSCICCWLQWS